MSVFRFSFPDAAWPLKPAPSATFKPLWVEPSRPGMLEHNPDEVLYGVHGAVQCAAQAFCPIHRRSAHDYRTWKQTFGFPAEVKRPPGVRNFMRRVCAHGRWVMDPDEKFKPTYAELHAMGAQDCAKCNPRHNRRLYEDYRSVIRNLSHVAYMLEQGRFAHTVILVEYTPTGEAHEMEFFPDEAVFYLGVCLAELCEELGLPATQGEALVIQVLG